MSATFLEFFLIHAAALGEKGFKAFDKSHPPERQAALKAL
ncbi:hypothetical protein BAP_3080 [Bacillus sp. CN2]|nr:hypothetical protein BAP_3080 [Bacillus sp. CN2]